MPISKDEIGTLSPEWLDRCDVFGREVVASYLAGKKTRSRFLQVPGKPPIYGDAEVQAMGRRCEIGVCLILGVDPRGLNWDGEKCDPGMDFSFHGTSVDVKGTDHPRAERLIWPVTKKEFYAEAADIFIFAKNGQGETVNKVWAPTWTTKEEFRRYCRTAKGEPGIIDGTWYMFRHVRERGMHPIGDLVHDVKWCAVCKKRPAPFGYRGEWYCSGDCMKKAGIEPWTK